MKELILLVLICTFSSRLSAQVNDLEPAYFSAEEIESITVDKQELMEMLKADKTDLNGSDLSLLINAELITMQQEKALKDHREKNGDLIHFNELQSIDGFDLATVRKLKAFAVVHETAQIRKGIFKKIRNVLTLKSGFRTNNDSMSFLNSSRNIFSYRFHSSGVQAGVLVERDPGEKIGQSSGSLRSAFVQLKQNNGVVASSTLGDYNLSFGEGLVLWTGYAISPMHDPSISHRTQTLLTPHTGTDENRYLRGAGIHLRENKMNLIMFGSSRSYEKAKGAPVFSRLASSRSFKELTVNSSGFNLFYKTRTFITGIIGTANILEHEIEQATDFRRLHHFSGKKNLAASAYYTVYRANTTFFGENAISENLKPSFLNGVIINAGKDASLSIRHVFASPAYHAMFSSPGTIKREGNNEESLQFIANLDLRHKNRISLSCVSYRSSWLRSTAKNFSFENRLSALVFYHFSKDNTIRSSISLVTPSVEESMLNSGRISSRTSLTTVPTTNTVFKTNVTVLFNKQDMLGYGLSQEIQLSHSKWLQLIGGMGSFMAEKNASIFQPEETLASFANPLFANGKFNRYYLLINLTPKKLFRLSVKLERTIKESVSVISGVQVLMRLTLS